MTAQLHEILILDGERTSMAYCPHLPLRHPRIKVLSRDEIDARCAEARRKEQAKGGDRSVSLLDMIFGSTGCWRRYQGTWEIKDEQFFLVGIEGTIALVGEEPLLADWFTGVLRVPRGERILYVHMGFGSVYEEELHILVLRGRVTARRIHDNRGKEFDAYQLGLENLPGGENRFRGDDFN